MKTIVARFGVAGVLLLMMIFGTTVSAADPAVGQISSTGSITISNSGVTVSGGQYNNAQSVVPDNVFATNGCAVGNYSCLSGNGVFIPNGYNGYYPGYPGYPRVYGAPNGYAYNGTYNPAAFYVPDSVFTNNGCTAGNYSCLIGNGGGGNLPASFFMAVGCAYGNYSCATSDTVFTDRGCTVGNYQCVFDKTGVTP